MGDFLRKNATTTLVQNFVAAGVPCRLATNSPSILAAATETFDLCADYRDKPEFFMRLWADGDRSSTPPWPKPHLRGLGHLVYAGFDQGSFALLDLRLLRIVGRTSANMAEDTSHWKRAVFPMFMSVIGASVGITELHCACVARGDNGILLAGQSHCGKSTLALALAYSGFSFLSDDRTCCSLRDDDLRAWSLPTDLKLRSQAVRWFPGLVRNDAASDQTECRLQPDALPGIARARSCKPRCLIFLEPHASTRFEIIAISPEDAAARLQVDLISESPEVTARQTQIIASLATLQCHVLRYNEDPWSVAGKIRASFDELDHNHISHPDTRGRAEMSENCGSEIRAPKPAVHGHFRRLDPLGRFTATNYQATVSAMGKCILVQTNSSNLLRRIQELLSIYPHSTNRNPHFRWEIVQQPASPSGTGGFRRSAFSDIDLRLAQIGRRSFYAVDLESRAAIGSVAKELFDDTPRFIISFLDSLFCMSASSLGLVSLYANGVAHKGAGAIILGAPGSGKTCASYLAAQRGMTFHADEGVFLEMHKGQLRAWGGFWPISFRKESACFFPEIPGCAREFVYGDLSYYHLEKRPSRSRGKPVVPACCIFLRRGTATDARVSRVAPSEAYQRLLNSLLFEEEERFRAQQELALTVLAGIPAYEVNYGPDPIVAAELIGEILTHHNELPGPVEVAGHAQSCLPTV